MKRRGMFIFGVYCICGLVVLAGGKMIIDFFAEENHWLIYFFVLIFVWPTYLQHSVKTNLHIRSEARKNAILELKSSAKIYFFVACGGLLFGNFTEIVELDKIKSFLLFFLLIISYEIFGKYFAYLLWQPKSKIALNDCMKLFLQAKDGSRAKARWQKMLLKNFDADGSTVYDSPYTWLEIIERAVYFFKGDKDKLEEINKVFLEVELSFSSMEEAAAIVKNKEQEWQNSKNLDLQMKTLAIMRNKVEDYFARQ